jgi:predicted ester cyclase
MQSLARYRIRLKGAARAAHRAPNGPTVCGVSLLPPRSSAGRRSEPVVALPGFTQGRSALRSPASVRAGRAGRPDRSSEQVLGFLGVFWDAFPDGRLETSRLFAEGSVVAAEGRFIGTHTGVMRTPAGDFAATGRNVDFRWMSSYEVRGDELASEHLYFDQAELLGQLGLMPAP